MENGRIINIETQEIRGINIKVMLTVIAAVVSSTIAIIMTINGLRTDLLRIQTNQEKQAEISDLKLRTLDIRVTSMEVNMKDLNDRIQKNEDRINEAAKNVKGF